MNRIGLFCVLFILLGFGARSQSRIFNFYANPLGDSIRLNFTITAGNACAGWQILKGSDSLNLQFQYSYPGICGNTSFAENYKWTDFSPNKTSPNFYRILVPPGDYSNIIRVDLAASFNDNMLIYPQPAETELNIAFTNKKNFYYEIKIYDRYGRKMGDGNGTAAERITLNVSSFPLGVYVFYVVDINGNAYRGKFLKN